MPNLMSAAEPGGPSIYVNGIAIYFSPWDFSLMFLRGLPSEGAVERSDTGELRFNASYRVAQSVVMSPQHAKAMLAALAENIELYEAEHGSIPTVAPSTTGQPEGSSSTVSGVDDEVS
ncbi:MAG: DUF3467 domain-containing protein [Solirubrobacterales bacterium]|nr:DUF3467 domain-containing protein [Solirubrobacterales bacterium]